MTKRPRVSALWRSLAPLWGDAAGIDLAERLARPSPTLRQAIEAAGADRAQLIIDTYEQQTAAATRTASGVFYTPPLVVDAMLDRLPASGIWLDPAAGAGAFLVGFVRRYGRAGLPRLLANDIDAQALDVAALAIEAALGPESRADVEHWRRTRTHTVDFLHSPWPGGVPDVIVGNPPYGLSDDDRLGTLFPVLQGERDLYAGFLLRSMERVRPGGTLSLLVPDTWLSNRRDAGLRAALATYGVERVIDFGKPFTSARDTRVHAVMLRAGADRCGVESERGGALLPMADTNRPELQARAPRGWCLYRTSAESQACRVIERGTRLGDRFEVIYGLRTGDNKRHVRDGPGAVPLLGGRDLDAYDRHVRPKHLALPEEFARSVQRQRGRLKLGVQRIRTNSRLPWRRWVEAAPVLPDEVGLDSLSLIACRAEHEDALWALLGVLCSSVVNHWYRLTFTDVNVKPTYLSELPLPPLDARLALLAKARADKGPDADLERLIDRLVFDAYGFDEVQIRCFEDAFWGERAAEMPLPSTALAWARSEEPRRRNSGPRLSPTP